MRLRVLACSSCICIGTTQVADAADVPQERRTSALDFLLDHPSVSLFWQMSTSALRPAEETYRASGFFSRSFAMMADTTGGTSGRILWTRGGGVVQISVKISVAEPRKCRMFIQ